MNEPDQRSACSERLLTTVSHAWRGTLEAGRWILATPFAWVVIASGMLFDHLARLFVTLNSAYFRLIDLPWVIGS